MASLKRTLTRPVPVKLTLEIDRKVCNAAAKTGLKKSDVLRLSIERGVDVLLAQLVNTSQPAA